MHLCYTCTVVYNNKLYKWMYAYVHVFFNARFYTCNFACKIVIVIWGYVSIGYIYGDCTQFIHCIFVIVDFIWLYWSTDYLFNHVCHWSIHVCFMDGCHTNCKWQVCQVNIPSIWIRLYIYYSSQFVCYQQLQISSALNIQKKKQFVVIVCYSFMFSLFFMF